MTSSITRLKMKWIHDECEAAEAAAKARGVTDKEELNRVIARKQLELVTEGVIGANSPAARTAANILERELKCQKES